VEQRSPQSARPPARHRRLPAAQLGGVVRAAGRDAGSGETSVSRPSGQTEGTKEPAAAPGGFGGVCWVLTKS